MRRIRRVLLVLVALVVLGVLAACGGGSDSETPAADATTSAEAAAEGDGTISLVAYSTPQDVYEELITAFQGTPEGDGIDFEQSYDASGAQSRAVEAGLPADYVAFSLDSDMTRLVDAGIVAPEWQETEKYNGMVSDSVVVLAVRDGNPKNIQGWDDLVREDVEVITPNPFTSGGARWNLMAAYGAQIQAGKTEDEAVQYLADVLANTPVQDKSAREALQTFVSGKGDVMLAYENEAIFAQGEGQPIEYIVPDETILIENPAAVTVTGGPEAADWLSFVQSPEAQTVFAEHGYRPVDPDVAAQFDFPQPSGLFTIDDFGGWSEVRSTFFDPDTGIVAGIEKELGVPTDS
jgi:sulfate/thiosulfate transport system substrate-binding protein